MDLRFPCYQIYTNRLVLACYQPQNAQMMKDMATSNKEHLSPRMEFVQYEPQSYADKVELLRKRRSDYDRDIDYVIWIFDRNNYQLIWSTWVSPKKPDRFELWYRIDKKHSWQWYIQETVKALTCCIFTFTNADFPEIKCDLENKKSANVAKKCWYTHETNVKVVREHLGSNIRYDMIRTMAKTEAKNQHWYFDIQSTIKAYWTDGKVL